MTIKQTSFFDMFSEMGYMECCTGIETLCLGGYFMPVNRRAWNVAGQDSDYECDWNVNSFRLSTVTKTNTDTFSLNNNTSDKNIANGLSSNAYGLASNERSSSSNEYGLANNEHGLPSNERGLANNEHRLSINEHGMANNDDGMANNDLGLEKCEGRSEDPIRMSDIKKHLVAIDKWRTTLRWKPCYSITFVIPELHRMAIWWVPNSVNPDALKRSGDNSGGIYQAIKNQSDIENSEVVLWKHQQQIKARVDENERLQFDLSATTEPDAILVDLIRRGKKKVDYERAK